MATISLARRYSSRHFAILWPYNLADFHHHFTFLQTRHALKATQNQLNTIKPSFLHRVSLRFKAVSLFYHILCRSKHSYIEIYLLDTFKLSACTPRLWSGLPPYTISAVCRLAAFEILLFLISVYLYCGQAKPSEDFDSDHSTFMATLTREAPSPWNKNRSLYQEW